MPDPKKKILVINTIKFLCELLQQSHIEAEKMQMYRVLGTYSEGKLPFW